MVRFARKKPLAHGCFRKKWAPSAHKLFYSCCFLVLGQSAGFWQAGMEAEAENVWTWCASFNELDSKKKADGSELDEFQSHKFLETLGEAMTVTEVRRRAAAACGSLCSIRILGLIYSHWHFASPHGSRPPRDHRCARRCAKST